MDVTINQSALLHAVKVMEPYQTMDKNDFPFIYLSADEKGLWVFATNRFTLSVVYYPTEVRETGWCSLPNNMFSNALRQMENTPVKIKTNEENTGIVLSQKGFRLRLQVVHTETIIPVQAVIEKLESKPYPVLMNIYKADLLRLIRLSDMYPKHTKDERRWLILQAQDGILQCSTQDTELGKVEELEIEGTIEGEGRIVVDTEELKVALRLCGDIVFLQSGEGCPVMIKGTEEGGAQWWSTLSQWTLK